MKQVTKLLVCVCGYFILALSFNIVIANEANAVSESAKMESYIASLYRRIDFSNSERISYTVFNNAMRGYLNLRNAGKLTGEKEIITICDLNQPSTFNRLWVIDLATKKVLFNSYVAHGQNTGEDCAMTFSNKMNSHQSSLGFYITTDVYKGEHGTSLHLQGMDQGFNDAAFERDIVVHGAEYVSDKYINDNQRLGRSWGCPAVPVKLAEPIINTIKDGTCLFIYYPDTRYLANSYWLNRKMAPLPDQQLHDDMMPLELEQPRMRTIQYIHNGKIDSVKKIAR
ncbi:murein L,D-transpeptidase catalytic domain family protein [Nemorincola caseinilytica]